MKIASNLLRVARKNHFSDRSGLRDSKQCFQRNTGGQHMACWWIYYEANRCGIVADRAHAIGGANVIKRRRIYWTNLNETCFDFFLTLISPSISLSRAFLSTPSAESALFLPFSLKTFHLSLQCCFSELDVASLHIYYFFSIFPAITPSRAKWDVNEISAITNGSGATTKSGAHCLDSRESSRNVIYVRCSNMILCLSFIAILLSSENFSLAYGRKWQRTNEILRKLSSCHRNWVNMRLRR